LKEEKKKGIKKTFVVIVNTIITFSFSLSFFVFEINLLFKKKKRKIPWFIFKIIKALT
jgi:hypothetical protein